jgi:hypothetical protein
MILATLFFREDTEWPADGTFPSTFLGFASTVVNDLY